GLLGDHLLDDAELLKSGLAGRGEKDRPHPAPSHRLEQDIFSELERVGFGHRRRYKLGDRKTEAVRTRVNADSRALVLADLQVVVRGGGATSAVPSDSPCTDASRRTLRQARYRTAGYRSAPSPATCASWRRRGRS